MGDMGEEQWRWKDGLFSTFSFFWSDDMANVLETDFCSGIKHFLVTIFGLMGFFAFFPLSPV